MIREPHNTPIARKAYPLQSKVARAKAELEAAIRSLVLASSGEVNPRKYFEAKARVDAAIEALMKVKR